MVNLAHIPRAELTPEQLESIRNYDRNRKKTPMLKQQHNSVQSSYYYKHRDRLLEYARARWRETHPSKKPKPITKIEYQDASFEVSFS